MVLPKKIASHTNWEAIQTYGTKLKIPPLRGNPVNESGQQVKCPTKELKHSISLQKEQYDINYPRAKGPWICS